MGTTGPGARSPRSFSSHVSWRTRWDARSWPGPVEVEGITLWLFGGVAKLKGDPKTAWGELNIAIAGRDQGRDQQPPVGLDAHHDLFGLL